MDDLQPSIPAPPTLPGEQAPPSHQPSTAAELAARLYAPQQANLPEPDGTLADAIYNGPARRTQAEAQQATEVAYEWIGEPGAAVIERRKSREVAPSSYAGVAVEEALDPDLIPAVRRGIGNVVRELAADVGIDQAEFGLSVAAARSVARMSADDVKNMEAETFKALRETYGEQHHEKLTLARKMVAAHPQLGQLLEQTKLGSHPRTVLALVDAATRMQRTGRLR